MSHAEQIITLRRAGKHEEACSLAVALAAQYPEDAELQYPAASALTPPQGVNEELLAGRGL